MTEDDLPLKLYLFFKNKSSMFLLLAILKFISALRFPTNYTYIIHIYVIFM